MHTPVLCFFSSAMQRDAKTAGGVTGGQRALGNASHTDVSGVSCEAACVRVLVCVCVLLWCVCARRCRAVRTDCRWKSNGTETSGDSRRGGRPPGPSSAPSLLAHGADVKHPPQPVIGAGRLSSTCHHSLVGGKAVMMAGQT